MKNQRQKIGGYLWGFSGVLIAIGFIVHPPLTPEGMLQNIWIPDHVIILISLFALIFALGLITFSTPDEVNKLGWLGFVFLNVSAFLLIGIVYFELFLVPILARELPELFSDGLRIGPLKLVLPITAVLFVMGHIFYGIALIRKNILPTIPFAGLMVFSIPLAFKPVLPDLVATIGAIGYGIFSVYFAIQYVKTSVNPELVSKNQYIHLIKP